jgi:hypothetical protein
VPDAGRLRVGVRSWSLYSATGNIPMALSEAIIATYMTIHMARSPSALGAVEALSGRAMTATERTHKRRRKHGLEAKAEEFSVFAAHSWASGTRDWN